MTRLAMSSADSEGLRLVLKIVFQLTLANNMTRAAELSVVVVLGSKLARDKVGAVALPAPNDRHDGFLPVKTRDGLGILKREAGAHLDAVDEEHITRLVEVRLERRLDLNGSTRNGKRKPALSDSVELLYNLVTDRVMVRELEDEVNLVRLEVMDGRVLASE
jgi:hypothetical protein